MAVVFNLRRWRERRQLLREAEGLEATARRRDTSLASGVYAIVSIAAAAAGTVEARNFASVLAELHREETAAIRAKAQALREEAGKLV